MATVSLQTLGYHWEIPAVCPAFPFCGQLGFIPRWVSTQDHGQPTLVSKGSVWLPSPLDSCLGHGGGVERGGTAGWTPSRQSLLSIYQWA